MRKGATITKAMLAVAILLAATAPMAIGSNIGSQGTPGASGQTNGVFFLPNSTMTVKPVVLGATNMKAVSLTLNDSYVPTDLIVRTGRNDANCLDDRVCVFDGYYGKNGLYGWNACYGNTTGNHPAMRCSQAYVRLNQSYTPPSYKRLACHELGHSVGLRHTSFTGTCMTTSITSSNSSRLRSGHEMPELDRRYS